MSPKYVSNGTFGCVFRPNVPCKSSEKSSESKVSKLFKDSYDAYDEYNSQEEIKKIDPKSKFTVKPYDYCDINTSHFKKDIDKCDNFDDTVRWQSKLSQIIYEYGGISLINAALTIDPIKLFPSFLNIFQGLKVLKYHKQIHLDIKPANIVYNPKTKKMSLIDFGLMTRFNDIYIPNKICILEYDYPYYPPEFDISLSYIDPNTYALDAKSINKKPQNAFKFLGPFLDVYFDKKDLTRIHDEFSNEITKIGKKSYKYLKSDAIDIYSLGITMLECLSLANSKFIIDSNFVITLVNFIRQLINPFSDRRLSPENAYESFKTLCINAEFKKPSPVKPKPSLIKIKSFKSPKSILQKSVVTQTTQTKKAVVKSISTQITPPVVKSISTQKTPKICIPPKILNIMTGRCNNPPKEKKPCVPPKIRNPLTGRCKNPPK